MVAARRHVRDLLKTAGKVMYGTEMQKSCYLGIGILFLADEPLGFFDLHLIIIFHYAAAHLLLKYLKDITFRKGQLAAYIIKRRLLVDR